MSVDGTGLFDDDTAHDVREQFTKLLADTQKAAIATERLVAEWEDSLQRSDEGPVFWLGPAMLEIAYPAEARVLLKLTHATVGGREIAVVIRRY